MTLILGTRWNIEEEKQNKLQELRGYLEDICLLERWKITVRIYCFGACKLHALIS